jgi:signal transduction histidine kinase
LSLTWFFIKNQVVQIRTTLEDRCTILARNLASSSEFGVITSNKDFLAKLNDAVVDEEEDIVYSVIYDKNGKILALNEKSSTKDIYKELAPLVDYKMHIALKKDQPFDNQFIKDVIKLTYDSKTGQTIHDTVCPIMIDRVSPASDEQLIDDYRRKSSTKEELIGFARVGISLSRMQKQISDTKFGVMVLTSIVIVIGILLSIFLVRIIVKPIRQLSLGTRQLASGDLNYHVDVQSNDEIGELADSFNAMASDLRKYVKELRKEKEDLLTTKGTLEQQTKELEETLVKMTNIQQELLRSEKFASIGRLSSSIAHELRNPLTSLKNISYYLTKRGTFNDDAKANQMLGLLSMDVARANKIVTDLLDFARIKKITKSPLKLDEFVRNFLDSVDFGENIRIKQDLESVRVEIDPDKMSQVLLNLLSNSRDAMPEGGDITITTRKNETMAVIHIADTGQGMDDETMEHIFDPLFSTKTRGLGLSLAIVKEIIDLHSGTVTVVSSKGKGTSFDINLPL